MNNGSEIASHGGNITISGTGDNANQTGISLDNATLNAGGGNISLTGSSSAGNGGNTGVALQNGSTVETSGTGTITVNGTASGSGFFGGNNTGVALTGGSVVENNGGSGAITVTGTGTGSGFSLFGFNGSTGVSLQDGSGIESSGSAPITITGISDSNGIGIAASANSYCNPNLVGGWHDNGNITFVADTMDVGQSLNIQTSANVTFVPYTSSTSIGIAGAAGTLQITSDLLNNTQAGSITIGNTTSDSGTLTANSYDWDPPSYSPSVAFLNDNGNIVIRGMQTMGNGTFLAVTSNGNITIGSKGGVNSKAWGNSIVLAASNGDFTNYGGANALDADHGGRWLVYSKTPAGDTFDGLAENFEQFNAPYYTAAIGSGNGFLFSSGLTLTIGLTGTVTKTYDGTTSTADSTLSSSNFTLNSGYQANIGYSTANTTYASPNAGTGITITATGLSASNVETTSGATVYGYTVNNSAFASIGVITPAQLTITANNQTMVYGANSLPTLTVGYNGFVNGESASSLTAQPTVTTTATAYNGVAGSGSNVGGYAITASGAVDTNYSISYVGGTLHVTPATLDVAANYQIMGYLGAMPSLTYRFGGLVNGDTNGVFTGGLATTSPTSLVGLYPITQGSLSAGANYNIVFTPGLLDIAVPSEVALLQQGLHLPTPKGPGQIGILLALATFPGSSLGGLAPAAGGNPPHGFDHFSPEQLANLNPTAGGPGAGGILPLIGCSEDTPCQINQ